MNAHRLLKLPYQAARMPLAAFDAKLVKRLPTDSRPRLAFERMLGSLDEAAGRLLKDRRVEHRGTGLREHADTLSDAVALEQDAAQRRRAAADAVSEADQRATSLRQAAQRRQRDGVQQAVENERADKRAATRRAGAQAAAAKTQADARATRALQSVDQKRKLAETRATARTRKATAEAKGTLDEAAAKKAAARTRRSEADQLGKLTEAKQQARKR